MHSCWEVGESYLGCADWYPTKESKLTVNSQPRDAGRCLRNIYNCFSHACQWLGKCLQHYAFWLLLCSNVCLSKHKIRGQQISGQISKSLLGFGPRLNDFSIASGFHVLRSTQHQPLALLQKEEWDLSSKEIVEPSAALRNPSMCSSNWGDYISILCNSWGSHIIKLSG